MTIDERISVSALSSYRNTFDDDLRLWDRLGIRFVGCSLSRLETAGWDFAVHALRSAGMRVSCIVGVGPRLDHPQSWVDHRERLIPAVEAAAALRCSLALASGRAGPLPWEQAAERMLDAWGPTTQLAHSLGVPLLVEHAHSLRADISFVHTLRDALDLARMARVGVLCELAACWAERGFAETFADGHELIRLVQVSDFVIGTKQTPDRAVPGDGDVPLRRLLQQIQATGYKQPFELELIGPRIEQEGYENAIRRALTELASMLEKVDADREPA